MSSSWDINSIRKLAGLSLITESYDDDDVDDEDPDVRIANKDKGQASFERTNQATLAAADKAVKSADKKKAASKPAADAKKAEPKEAPKAEPAKKKAEPAEASKAEPAKKEAPKAEPAADTTEPAAAKKRGKAPNADSSQQRCISWLRSNPKATRAEFLKYASSIGMSTNYASSRLSAYRKLVSGSSITEGWVFSHPHIAGYLLGESHPGSGLRWLGESDIGAETFVTTAAERDQIVQHMADWKSMAVVPVHVELDD